MKKILWIFIIGLTFSQVASDFTYSGAKATALSGALVAHPGDVNSVFHNPAGLSELENNEFTIGFSKLYNYSFLPMSHFATSFNLDKFGNVGLFIKEMNVEYSGNKLSSEQDIGLSHSLYLQKDRNSKLSIGYTLHFLNWDLGASAGSSGDGSDGITLGSISTFGVDIGLLSVLRNKYRVGVMMTNVNSPEVGRGISAQPLPRKINVGISLIPYQNVVTSLVLERTLGEKDKQIKSSIEYTLNKYIVFRLGVQSNPNRIGTGFALQFAGVDFSYGLLTHPILPTTHQTNIGYKF